MALVTLPRSFEYPSWYPIAPTSGTISTGTTLNATANKLSGIGKVWWPGTQTGTKAIRQIGIRWGTIVKAGGTTGIRVSLEDVDYTAGPIIRPDFIEDQFVVIPNADINSNTFMISNALNADRTVSFGDRLCVVCMIEGTRLGSDSFPIAYLGGTAGVIDSNSTMATQIGATSSNLTGVPAFLLVFSDGSYGCLSPGWPMSNFAGQGYTSDFSPEEHGVEFKLPFDCACDGAVVLVGMTASGDASINLYDAASTLLATSFLDANAVQSLSTQRVEVRWPKKALTKDTVYRLGLRALTSQNLNIYYYDASNAAMAAIQPGGANFYYVTHVVAGTFWSPTTTRRPYMSLLISDIDVSGGAVEDWQGGHLFGRMVMS